METQDCILNCTVRAGEVDSFSLDVDLELRRVRKEQKINSPSCTFLAAALCRNFMYLVLRCGADGVDDEYGGE